SEHARAVHCAHSGIRQLLRRTHATRAVLQPRRGGHAVHRRDHRRHGVRRRPGQLVQGRPADNYLPYHRDAVLFHAGSCRITAISETSDSALDPVYRSSEVIFGLLMAMSFIGSISVASDGREEVRTLLVAALGCNLAWGLVDAVMHLVATKTQQRRNRALLGKLRAGADAATGRALIADEMPGPLAASIGHDGLEQLRQRLTASVPAAPRRDISARDVGDAVIVFFLVVLSTFPVVVPF